LQIGPASAGSEGFASWRSDRCAAFWNGLRKLQQQAPGRLAALASTRYRNRDFGAVLPFLPLPAHALWRMLSWFPSLRRLSEGSRVGLVERLAGHPRAVDFLDALIADSILSWESDLGPFVPGCLSPEDERAQIVATALPRLEAQLSEDLLFDALWDRVLEVPERELLVRTGVLRRPGDRGLVSALGGENADATIRRLLGAGLLTEVREPRPEGGWVSTFEVHSTVFRLAERRSQPAEVIWREDHQRAGEYLERVAQRSPSWEDNIEGAYHLRQIGEVDRAFNLIAPLIEWLQQRGRIQDSLLILAEIGDPASLAAENAAIAHSFHGTAAEI
jgi:hypothetical protein